MNTTSTDWAHLKGTFFDDVDGEEYRRLGRDFKPRLDGNWEHRRPVRLHWTWDRLAWRSWFTSHRIETGSIPAHGLTGMSCMPGNVRTYAVVVHLGPLRVIFGPA